MPFRGYGSPSIWGDDRRKQVVHFTNWTYTAVHCLCRNFAKHVPNMARVSHQRKPGKTFKHADAPFGWFGGTAHTEFSIPGVSPIVEKDGPNTFNTVTAGSYFRKSLSVIKPHEELEPLPPDHPLVRLIDNPNDYDTTFELLYELDMFLELCGVSYLWCVPNGAGVPCELWVIPAHWVWPRSAYGYVAPDDPRGGQLIIGYEVRPWGAGRGQVFFPADEVIAFRWPSPLNKIDGYSTMTAISMWIDSEEAMTQAQWSQFNNEARPSVAVEMGPEYQDPTDDQIARVEAKFMAKYQGTFNAGKPIIVPPGVKVTPFGFNPTEMSYITSKEQARDEILAAYAIPPAAVGLVKEMTFGSILATMAAMYQGCLNPRFTMLGQRLTKCLAPRFAQDDDEPIRLWWDDVTPLDPQQVNADLAEDRAHYAVTPNEVRAIRGRPAYKHGGDDPFIQGPGGIVPYPINTGENLQPLADLIPILPKDLERGQEGDELLKNEGMDIPTEEKPGVPGEQAGGKPPGRLNVKLGAPKVEEPNGPPQKGPHAAPKKELVRAVVKAALKEMGGKTIAVDLDGTLAEYDGWKGEEHFGDPRPGARAAMQALRNAGHTLIIFTTRGNEELVADWLEKVGIPYDHINDNPDQPEGSSGKVIADLYIDDRAINARDHWGSVLDDAEKFLEQVKKPNTYKKKIAKPSVEKTNGPHKYASTQFNLVDGGYDRSQGSPLPKLEAMQAKIDDADLADVGKEDTWHVTCLYGLVSDDPKEVANVVAGFGPVEVTLGLTSIFQRRDEGKEYDVVKVDVASKDLQRLHQLIADSLPNVSTHPDYKPHVTLAYVAAGLGEKHAGDASVRGMKLTFGSLVFSPSSGEDKMEIKLTVKPPPKQPDKVVEKGIDEWIAGNNTGEFVEHYQSAGNTMHFTRDRNRAMRTTDSYEAARWARIANELYGRGKTDKFRIALAPEKSFSPTISKNGRKASDHDYDRGNGNGSRLKSRLGVQTSTDRLKAILKPTPEEAIEVPDELFSLAKAVEPPKPVTVLVDSSKIEADAIARYKSHEADEFNKALASYQRKATLEPGTEAKAEAGQAKEQGKEGTEGQGPVAAAEGAAPREAGMAGDLT